MERKSCAILDGLDIFGAFFVFPGPALWVLPLRQMLFSVLFSGFGGRHPKFVDKRGYWWYCERQREGYGVVALRLVPQREIASFQFRLGDFELSSSDVDCSTTLCEAERGDAKGRQQEERTDTDTSACRHFGLQSRSLEYPKSVRCHVFRVLRKLLVGK